MKKIKLITTIILLCAAIIIQQTPAAAQKAEGAADPKGSEKETPPNVLNPENWYLKLSTVVSYYTFGSNFDKMIGQVHGISDGSPLTIKTLTFNPSFSMAADDKVERAATNFIPTGNIGFGWISGRHQFEIDLGVAGMVPLNTIQADTKMTMTEKAGDTTLEGLGLVDSTGMGRYSLQVTMNEEIWIITPSFYYDYTVLEMPWGKFSTGGSLGLVFMSMTQNVDFKAVRQDAGPEPEDQRAFEASALSTAVNGFGPVMRLYGGFNRPFFGDTRLDIRLGINYGNVYLERDMDGYGMITMGDGTLPISFPLSALSVEGKPFKNSDENIIELMGAFIQVGILF